MYNRLHDTEEKISFLAIVLWSESVIGCPPPPCPTVRGKKPVLWRVKIYLRKHFIFTEVEIQEPGNEEVVEIEDAVEEEVEIEHEVEVEVVDEVVDLEETTDESGDDESDIDDNQACDSAMVIVCVFLLYAKYVLHLTKTALEFILQFINVSTIIREKTANNAVVLTSTYILQLYTV
jgi:hypothetical protein